MQPSTSRVLKFGGAALRDGAAVADACALVAARGGERPVVVVSAALGVTSLLEQLADGAVGVERVRIRHRTLLRELGLPGDLLDGFLRELGIVLGGRTGGRTGGRGGSADGRSIHDHVLSFGERMSARIVAAALRERGTFATPVDAWDLGLVVERRGGIVRPVEGAAGRVRRSIAEIPGVPVVTGFLAADRAGNLMTLGRNGSDLTALLLAEAARAGEVQLWKHVSGVMTADPALVPHARPVAEIGFDEAYELARIGARVLHPEAVDEARRVGVPVRLLDARAPDAPGTRLVRSTPRRGPVAIACSAPEGSTRRVAIVGPGVGSERALGEQVARRLEVALGEPAERSERALVWRVAEEDACAVVRELHDGLFARHERSEAVRRSR